MDGRKEETMAENMTSKQTYRIVTAGSTYLDIDAYACAVALAELAERDGYPTDM